MSVPTSPVGGKTLVGAGAGKMYVCVRRMVCIALQLLIAAHTILWMSASSRMGRRQIKMIVGVLNPLTASHHLLDYFVWRALIDALTCLYAL